MSSPRPQPRPTGVRTGKGMPTKAISLSPPDPALAQGMWAAVTPARNLSKQPRFLSVSMNEVFLNALEQVCTWKQTIENSPPTTRRNL